MGLLERPLVRSMFEARTEVQRKTQQRAFEPLLGPRQICGALVARGCVLFSFEGASNALRISSVVV